MKPVNNMELIDAYCNKELLEDKQREVEQRIASDPAFAEEFAFYLSAHKVAAVEMTEKREHLRTVFEEYKKTGKPPVQRSIVRRILPWAAAAAALVVIVWSLLLFQQPNTSKDLADKYIHDNFQTLSVSMNAAQDSLQKGLAMYNDGNLPGAQQLFESLLAKDTTLFEARKYAGIVALRLAEYDKAITHFYQLGNYTHLYSNPGKFYHALTLMKRDQPGDKQRAKELLQKVVESGLEEKKEAQVWLKKV